MKKVLLSIFAMSVLAGCSSVPMVQENSNELKIIQSFEPSKENAVVYLYRDRDSEFGLFELSIEMGDEDVMTYPACYRRIELSPGMWAWEANHPDVFGFEGELDFEAKAGEVSYFEYLPIARFGVPGETKILPKTKEEAVDKITNQQLCVNPLVKLTKKD